MTAAFRTAGVTGGPPKPAILASPSAYCATLCHSRVMPSDKVFFREMELQFPHALHVKDVGIECAKCHSPEKHKMRIVTKSECMKCHHESKDIDCVHCHKAQQALYEGKVKAYGATPAQDVMAAGKTKCIECHDLKKGTQTVLTVKAKCEGCHDAKYGKMLLDWKQEITKQENAIAVALEEAKEYVSRTKKAGKDVSKEETLVRQADANYQAVSAGRGVHNYKLSREMLRAAQADLDKVLAAKRQKYGLRGNAKAPREIALPGRFTFPGVDKRSRGFPAGRFFLVYAGSGTPPQTFRTLRRSSAARAPRAPRSRPRRPTPCRTGRR